MYALCMRTHTHTLNLSHSDVLSGFHCTNPMHLILLNSMTKDCKIQTALHDATQYRTSASHLLFQLSYIKMSYSALLVQMHQHVNDGVTMLWSKNMVMMARKRKELTEINCTCLVTTLFTVSLDIQRLQNLATEFILPRRAHTFGATACWQCGHMQLQ